MQSKEAATHFRDLTRGGQTFMHAIRMFMQVFKYALSGALILFACLFLGFAVMKTTSLNRYLFYQYLEAKLKLSFNEQAYNIIRNPKGSHPPIVEIPSSRFIKEPITQYHVKQCLKGLLSAFNLAFYFSVLALFLFLMYLKQKGKRAKTSEKVLGHGQVSMIPNFGPTLIRRVAPFSHRSVKVKISPFNASLIQLLPSIFSAFPLILPNECLSQ